MTDDLVERVALAIADDDWDGYGCIHNKVEYRLMARRAIAAIEAAGYVIVPREPTESMIDAGAIYADCNGAHGAWQAMIDCALKEDA